MTLEEERIVLGDTYLNLPIELIRFCPMCGLSRTDLSLEDLKAHLSDCLGCITNLQISQPSEGHSTRNRDEKSVSNQPKRRDVLYACTTCGKEYKMLYQLNKHRFFCERTVNLSEFEAYGEQCSNSRVIEQKSPSKDENQGNEIAKDSTKDSAHDVISNSQLFVIPSNITQDLQQEIFILPGVEISTTSEGAPQPANPTSERTDPVKETKNTQNICLICKKVFRLQKYLRRHILKTHGDDKPEICPYCNKGFKDKTSMKHHIRGHTNEKPFSCQYCNKAFRRKDSLIYHENSHRNERTFICSHCAKSFRNARDLKAHEKLQHLAKPNGEIQCKLCNIKFTTRKALTDHKELSHGIKPLECRFCKRTFLSAASLQDHERIHTGEKPFQCRFCIKTYRRNSHKMLHEKRHLLSGDYRCTACNKIFPQESELTRHIINTHSEKKFECQLCGKLFPSDGKLKQHLQKHEHAISIDTEVEQTVPLLPQQSSSIIQQALPQSGPLLQGGLQTGPLLQGALQSGPLLQGGLQSGPLLQGGLQTISVKTEKFKTTDDTITTKTVYVMEPDVPGGSSPTSMITGTSTILGSSYLLGVPQYRSDKEVGATIVIPAGKSTQDLIDQQTENHLTEIRLHQDSTFRF